MYGSLKIWGPPRRSQFHPGHGGPPIQYMLHAAIKPYVATARGDLPRRTLSPRDLELSERHEVALEVATIELFMGIDQLLQAWYLAQGIVQ